MGRIDDIDALIAEAQPASGPSDGVYDRLRGDILSGRLAGRGRLNIAALAERYETSTNPIREALQQLRGEGIVIFEPNRGARIRAIDADFVRDIYEIEELIEPYLTRWFVGQCTQEDLVRLQAIEDEIEALNFADPTRHSLLDTTFHMLMYRRHPNRHAVDLWWKHREILGGINIDNGISLKRRSAVIEQHRELIEAIAAHDEAAAGRVIAAHVRGSGLHIIDRMRMVHSG